MRVTDDSITTLMRQLKGGLSGKPYLQDFFVGSATFLLVYPDCRILSDRIRLMAAARSRARNLANSPVM